MKVLSHEATMNTLAPIFWGLGPKAGCRLCEVRKHCSVFQPVDMNVQWPESWWGAGFHHMSFQKEDAFPVFLCSYLQAIHAVTQINSSAWLCAQTYNHWEVCIEELGNPCHYSSLLSNQFPWKPTYVGTDKLKALWAAFHWCALSRPLFT